MLRAGHWVKRQTKRRCYIIYFIGVRTQKIMILIYLVWILNPKLNLLMSGAMEDFMYCLHCSCSTDDAQRKGHQNFKKCLDQIVTNWNTVNTTSIALLADGKKKTSQRVKDRQKRLHQYWRVLLVFHIITQHCNMQVRTILIQYPYAVIRPEP